MEFEFEYPRTLVSELASVPKFSDSPALILIRIAKLVRTDFASEMNLCEVTCLRSCNLISRVDLRRKSQPAKLHCTVQQTVVPDLAHELLNVSSALVQSWFQKYIQHALTETVGGLYEPPMYGHPRTNESVCGNHMTDMQTISPEVSSSRAQFCDDSSYWPHTTRRRGTWST